jgi:hypothetical protein
MLVKSLTMLYLFQCISRYREPDANAPNKSVYDGYEMARLKGLKEYNSDNPPAGSVKRANAQTFPNSLKL